MPKIDHNDLDHGNTWSANPDYTTDFNDESLALSDATQDKPLYNKRMQKKNLTAPANAAMECIATQSIPDPQQGLDKASIALTADQDQLLNDAADMLMGLERQISRYGSVQQIQYLKTTPIFRGSTGQIIEGSMDWAFTVQHPDKRNNRRVQFALLIREGVLQEPSVFMDNMNNVYPFTNEGFDKLFGPMPRQISIGTDVEWAAQG